MSTQFALQRCHWNAKLVAEFVHVPAVVESCMPTISAPVTTGGVDISGGAMAKPSTGEAMDSTGADDPTSFVATILTRSVDPRSLTGGTYDESVPPAMSVQLAPAPSHSSHWYVYADGRSDQMPTSADLI